MGLFNRRRNNFDGGQAQTPAPTDDYLNLTKYDEKFILPTDSGAQSAFGEAPSLGTATITSVRDIPVAEQQQGGERPMVFLSRKHNDIYIYEYSDRLEYYIRTSNSMMMLTSVKK